VQSGQHRHDKAWAPTRFFPGVGKLKGLGKTSPQRGPGTELRWDLRTKSS